MLTKLALGTTYEADCNAGNLVNFLDQIWFVCYQNNDNSLFYTPYKGVTAIKVLFCFVNHRLDDSQGYKEELKVKYSVTMTISGKFPNWTGFLEYLLAKEVAPLNWVDYCALSEANWIIWEGKADGLSKSVFLLVNLKMKQPRRIYVLLSLKVTSLFIQKIVNKWHDSYCYNKSLKRAKISTTTTYRIKRETRTR